MIGMKWQRKLDKYVIINFECILYVENKESGDQ